MGGPDASVCSTRSDNWVTIYTLYDLTANYQEVQTDVELFSLKVCANVNLETDKILAVYMLYTHTYLHEQ